MAAPAIRFEHVSKRYGKDPVVRDISLSIGIGERVAIVGTSGSGKSTLLHLMGALDTEFEGSLTVLGEELRKLSDGALANLRNRKIGFVFQAFHLLDHLTIAENVALASHFGHGAGGAQPTQSPAERARELLVKVGLSGRENDRPINLSGGQKQRVAIARALYRSPTLLLCDEPTGNLDTETGRQIIDLFCRLNDEEKITLIIVTHEDRVSRAAKRVIRLEDGRIVKDVVQIESRDSIPEAEAS